jgi:hypothetical protein
MRDPAYAAFSALDPFFDILGRAWQALSTVITTSTRSLPMRCSSFGIDFLAGQQSSWAVKPLWLCMRVTERVWRCMAQTRSW